MLSLKHFSSLHIALGYLHAHVIHDVFKHIRHTVEMQVSWQEDSSEEEDRGRMHSNVHAM